MKTTPIDERISALVDGEVTNFEARRVAQELMQDDARRDRWSRYHLIGDAMREAQPAIPSSDFAASVMAKIAVEEMPQVDVAKVVGGSVATNSRWAKPVIGLAIAASVAVVSIVSLKSLTSPDLTPGISMAEEKATSGKTPYTPTALAIPTSNQEAQPSELSVEPAIVDSNLESYLSNHAEFATQPSLLPEARVVGFGANEDAQ